MVAHFPPAELAPPRSTALERGLLAVLLACSLCTACGLDTRAQGTGAGATDAAVDHPEGAADAAGDVGHTCLPTPDQKTCGTRCVMKTDPDYGCDDPSCAPCALPHATATCKAGACAVGSCDPGYLDCDGLATNGCEVVAASDLHHCGDCGTDCSAIDPTKQWRCDSGKCELSCPAGTGDCNHDPSDGCETDTGTSSDNCGACGRACSSANGYGASCSQGLCSLSCYYPWGDCNHPAAPAADDGCETNLSSDPANCGACGAACSTSHSVSQACTNSTCSHNCQAGWADCNGAQPASSDDGCQTHTATDPDHCGSCTRPCSIANVATRSCQSGVCTSSCNADFGNCNRPAAPSADDGCETYLETPQNCGGCGRGCSNAHATSSSCFKGLCKPVCQSGWADCNSPAAPQADDGCECHGHCAGSVCKP